MPKQSYGLPYMGSKNTIAEDIISILPSGERLVDLFCGGCAITHCAMLSGKWKKFLVNDIDPRMPQTFIDAVGGKFADETRWISREDFHRLKDNDQFVRLCFSFGNNGQRYMYNKDREIYKRAAHHAIMFDDWSLLRGLVPELATELEKKLDGMPLDNWSQRDERRKAFTSMVRKEDKLYRMVNLTRLFRIESLECLKKKMIQDQPTGDGITLKASYLSYDEVPYKVGDVVYADPPYDGTYNAYGSEFDSARFWNWVATRDYPVYVSEYNAPEGFVEVFKKEKAKNGAGGHSSKYGAAVEKIFIHEKFKNEVMV